jgi:hypothetical protein
MLHQFLALPLVARIIAYVVAAGLALWVALKAKAIHAIVKKAIGTLADTFWGWVRKKLGLNRQQLDSNWRTYEGAFQDYWYTSLPRPMHFFKISRDGKATTVPVDDTSLFLGLKPGTFVEVDTEVRMGCEVVKRIRVQEPHG